MIEDPEAADSRLEDSEQPGARAVKLVAEVGVGRLRRCVEGARRRVLISGTTWARAGGPAHVDQHAGAPVGARPGPRPSRRSC